MLACFGYDVQELGELLQKNWWQRTIWSESHGTKWPIVPACPRQLEPIIRFLCEILLSDSGRGGGQICHKPCPAHVQSQQGNLIQWFLAFLITILFTESDQRDKCCDVISILALSALSALQSAINIAADHRFHLGSPDYEICIWN